MLKKPLKVGRKKMFENGPTPIQHHAAMLLALGKQYGAVSELLKISYEAIYDWMKYPIFTNLIDEYRKEITQKVKNEGFDDMKFLEDTMIHSLKAPAHRSDGLRARELLAKIRGEFSPEEMDLRIKKELSSLPEEELRKLEQEALLEDAESIVKSDTAGTPA